MAKTKEYILKPGYEHHGFNKNGERHTYYGSDPENNRVQLTEGQAQAFADRFESVEQMRERTKLQNEAQRAIAEADELRKKLIEQGIDPDALLRGEATIKKPDPSPSVGTAEPAPAGVTPAPVGSTSDPVSAPGDKNPAPTVQPPGVKSK